MAIVTRLTRLFRADMHAVLDRMEEPEVLLRQAIREMDEEIARTTQQLKLREIEQQQLRTRAAGLDAASKNIASELDLCFEANNEALVRTLLRRRLESEQLSRHFMQRLVQLDEQIVQQRRLLDDQRRRADGLRQKAALFDVETAADANSGTAHPNVDAVVISDADVELALLREQQKRRAS